MNTFTDYLQHLENSKFWGEVTLHYKDGHIHLLDQKQKLKLKQATESQSRKNHLESCAQTDGRHEPTLFTTKGL